MQRARLSTSHSHTPIRFDVAGVLFDCDGVLVASLDVVDDAWRRWSVEYGLDPVAVLPTIHGVRAVESIARLLPGDLVETATVTLEDLEVELSQTVTPIPGAIDLIESLPDGLWAVATSATRRLALARIQAAGIPMPDVLITADDVVHGKPRPDPYLAAAAALGAAPATCVVFEDTAAGVAAAAAAGATVVGIRTQLAEEDFAPHPSIPDLSAVTAAEGGPLGLTLTLG